MRRGGGTRRSQRHAPSPWPVAIHGTRTCCGIPHSCSQHPYHPPVAPYGPHARRPAVAARAAAVRGAGCGRILGIRPGGTSARRLSALRLSRCVSATPQRRPSAALSPLCALAEGRRDPTVEGCSPTATPPVRDARRRRRTPGGRWCAARVRSPSALPAAQLSSTVAGWGLLPPPSVRPALAAARRQSRRVAARRARCAARPESLTCLASAASQRCRRLRDKLVVEAAARDAMPRARVRSCALAAPT